MCESCGCEMIRLAEHPLRQRRPKGKVLGVRVKAAPAEPKSAPRVTTDIHAQPRPVLKKLTAEPV